ncbi:hypothetical protein GCM10011496_07170 [Polaromonas eurypsychrophila]|uniref:Uncharacterized protein n=1 Tax=Polaromonas eurypsychrophila TaxID=1614635 RepID=A0A916WD53_9BURK|nr:hypothetical protein GCM10011496_07170 [Polaromonas eurypsychrophila]
MRTGVNANIGSDVRSNANMGGSVSSNTNANTNATVNSDSTAKRAVKRTGNAVQRTGNKFEGAVNNAAGATRSGAYRAKNAVSGVAARADRGIQNNLPASNAGAAGRVNVQGSGNTSGQITPPPQ